MKKILMLSLSLVLIISGCSNTANAKTDEELRAEVEAEIKAEEALKEELKAELKAEMKETDQLLNNDLKNTEKLWTFILENIEPFGEITIDDMAFYYADIDGDNRDEVAVYSPECIGMKEVIFVRADPTGYHIIESDSIGSKYSHELIVENGFILHSYNTGGSGINTKGLHILKYNNGRIQDTTAYLATEESGGDPSSFSFETTGLIEALSADRWSSFKHTLTSVEEDLKTGKSKTEVKETLYEFDMNQGIYMVQDQSQDLSYYKLSDLSTGKSVSDKFIIKTEATGSSENEFLHYAFSLEGKEPVDVSLLYDTNEEDAIVWLQINENIVDKEIAVSRYEKRSLDAGSKFQIDFQNSRIGEDFIAYLIENGGGKIEGKASIPSILIEEDEMTGIFLAIVEDFEPKESELEKMANYLKEDRPPSMFENETLYSLDELIEINYDQYQLVVIPQQSSQHEALLDEKTINITNTGYEGLHKFTVIGQVISAKFTYLENPLDPDGQEQIVILDELIENSLVNVNVYLPTDFSHVNVELTYLKEGQEKQIEFSLDDMRDPESYEIIRIE